ncbi:cytoplasmic 60S subunit biogenesis factor ZNF622 isoform X1 [Hypanus sabinus]|uniref:cytoplasmic 60S subunit biogenesis factor ZNF622 isoform X1 n=2 Tax=Hypanus sabinus TaxID=79690 RepID=UPI0028C37F99|nr:cytoplasmic 60S subunit biogenesis factor ZNF622 isoform X1 [Hypanus sabinus]
MEAVPGERGGLWGSDQAAAASARVAISVKAMSSYTCMTCRVAFTDTEVQRTHYKTDWHRYNLKRKVADMPPVTAENFQERVLAQRAAVEEQNKGTATDCATCDKKFATFNAYENHLKSKKHLDAEKKAAGIANKELERLNIKNLEKGLNEERMDKDTLNRAIQQAVKAQLSPAAKKRTIDPTTGGTNVAVSKKRPDKPPRLLWLEQQAKKMGQDESSEEEEDVVMEIEGDGDWEDIDSADEVEDELEENESEVDKGLRVDSPPAAFPITDCLFCSHHSRTLLKNVNHMTKSHGFFIPDIEYLVDLRGLIKYLGEKVAVGNICLWCNEKGRSFYSLEAVQAHMVDSSHCKLFTDGDAAIEFADFYDFSESYPDQNGDDVAMKTSEVPCRNLEYNEETMELVLPSGARIGHRSLLRYYKQHFGTSRAVAMTGTRHVLGRLLQQYKALGWTSETAKEASQRKERDMQYVQRMKSKWMLKTAMSNNATKQMHFRPQVIF